MIYNHNVLNNREKEVLIDQIIIKRNKINKKNHHQLNKIDKN